MPVRKIIEIDDELCTGCGDCIPDCPEGALQMIDGKARLISDIFCDGLGACIGTCPVGAIKVTEREAVPYDEKLTMHQNIIPKGKNTVLAHLHHLEDHKQTEFLAQALEALDEAGMDVGWGKPVDTQGETSAMEGPVGGDVPEITSDEVEAAEACDTESLLNGSCPGSAIQSIQATESAPEPASTTEAPPKHASALQNWPIQITLMSPEAPYLKGADLLIAADCVAGSHPNFHTDLVKGKILLMGCPKLDDAQSYIEKLAYIIERNDIRSITTAIMTVPCCRGMDVIVKQAVAKSGKNVPVELFIVDLNGSMV